MNVKRITAAAMLGVSGLALMCLIGSGQTHPVPGWTARAAGLDDSDFDDKTTTPRMTASESKWHFSPHMELGADKDPAVRQCVWSDNKNAFNGPDDAAQKLEFCVQRYYKKAKDDTFVNYYVVSEGDGLIFCKNGCEVSIKFEGDPDSHDYTSRQLDHDSVWIDPDKPDEIVNRLWKSEGMRIQIQTEYATLFFDFHTAGFYLPKVDSDK